MAAVFVMAAFGFGLGFYAMTVYAANLQRLLVALIVLCGPRRDAAA